MQCSMSRALGVLWALAPLAGALSLTACVDDATAPKSETARPSPSAPPELATASLGSWTTKAPMPSPRAGLAGAVVQNSSGQYLLYAIGGWNENNFAMRRVEAYNAATNTWTRRANLPVDRRLPSAAAIGGKIYVVGGINLTGVVTKTLYVYTHATNTWTKKASLPVNTWFAMSAVMGGKLYVFTGAQLYRYDPATDAWTRRADPTNIHFGGVGGVIDGKLYVAGGGATSLTTDVYNPATNQWTNKINGQGDSCPGSACGNAAGVVFQKKLYMIGGQNGDEALQAVVAYDPITNAWTAKAPLRFNRMSRPIAGSVRNAAGSGRIVVAGGARADDELVSQTEMYAP
jgi:N-acetylneuraminic acid mutarotase